MASVCCCAGQSPASSLSLPSLIPNLGQPWWAKRQDTRGIGEWRWAGRRYCTGTDPVAFYSYRAPRNQFFLHGSIQRSLGGDTVLRLPTSGYVKRLVNNKLYSLYLQDVSHLGRQGYLSSYTLEISSKHTQLLFFSRPYLPRLHTHTTIRKHQQSTNRPTGIEHPSSHTRQSTDETKQCDHNRRSVDERKNNVNLQSQSIFVPWGTKGDNYKTPFYRCSLDRCALCTLKRQTITMYQYNVEGETAAVGGYLRAALTLSARQNPRA